MPSILLQTNRKKSFRGRCWKNILNATMDMSSSIEHSNVFESTQQVLKLSTFLPQVVWCLKEQSTFHWYFYKPPPNSRCEKPIKKHKKDQFPLLKIAFLSTRELKNVFGCSIEHSMCHHSFCRPHPNIILGEKTEKNN